MWMKETPIVGFFLVCQKMNIVYSVPCCLSPLSRFYFLPKPIACRNRSVVVFSDREVVLRQSQLQLQLQKQRRNRNRNIQYSIFQKALGSSVEYSVEYSLSGRRDSQNKHYNCV